MADAATFNPNDIKVLLANEVHFSLKANQGLVMVLNIFLIVLFYEIGFLIILY